jgi:hypothetical protein
MTNTEEKIKKYKHYMLFLSIKLSSILLLFIISLFKVKE